MRNQAAEFDIRNLRTRPWRGLALGSALLLAACAVEAPPGGDDAPSSAQGTAAEDVTPRHAATPGNADLRSLDPPSGPGAMAPNFAVGTDGVILTWLEPDDGGHSLRSARLDGETWSAPQPIASGDTFFANWADLPRVAASADGTMFAHWLAKLGEDTYAYGVQLASSQDGGGTWDGLGLLHDDASPTEHGFVSYTALPDGGVQAFWLDGRAMPEDRGMHLRTTRLGGGGPEASTLLDDRVCECCATDAALAGAGPVVVYRDRSPSEIRDIAVVRATLDGWSEPVQIHHDGWQIQGCPVNGPAIAAAGDHLAVAWFTAAKGQAKVQVVHSNDGGATFGEPVLVDGEKPLGRVDVEITGDGRTVVSWLGSAEAGAEIRWRQISPDGELGPVHVVSTTAVSRSAGVPRMIRRGDELLFVWVEAGEPSRLRAGLVRLS